MHTVGIRVTCFYSHDRIASYIFSPIGREFHRSSRRKSERFVYDANRSAAAYAASVRSARERYRYAVRGRWQWGTGVCGWADGWRGVDERRGQAQCVNVLAHVEDPKPINNLRRSGHVGYALTCGSWWYPHCCGCGEVWCDCDCDVASPSSWSSTTPESSSDESLLLPSLVFALPCLLPNSHRSRPESKQNGVSTKRIDRKRKETCLYKHNRSLAKREFNLIFVF